MDTSDGNKRLDRVVAYVKAQYQREAAKDTWHPVYTANYRWEHSQRVAHYGEIIAHKEGHDRELCVVACLLHDIAYFHCGDEEDWSNHGRIGSRISRPVLVEAGYSEQETSAICHAIAVHVDGESDVPHPHTPIADVVSDADNIDRFSAYRVVLWCMTERNDFLEMAAKLEKRVKRLHEYRESNPLATKTGQALFDEKLNLQITSFQAIIKDADITRLPRL